MNTPQIEGREKIAAFIKKRRTELGYSCEDIADATGLSRSTVWRVEEAKFSPSVDVLLTIISALNCHFLIGYNDGKTHLKISQTIK